MRINDTKVEDPMLGDTQSSFSIDQLQTPCLLLDESRMLGNIERLRQHLGRFGVPLRPHLKTAKSLDVALRLMSARSGPAAVSTLREAEYFGAAGMCDLLYTVEITPHKLDRVIAIRGSGIDLSVVIDCAEAAQAVVSKVRETGDRIPAFIEVDSDGHRAGVRQEEGSRLIEIGELLHEGGAALRGVMTHAGDSYNCRTTEAIERAAERERATAVGCAATLRQAGLPSPVVSVGSTPTAFFTQNLSGVTEVRAGVFVFFDLFMAGLGVCALGDIALSVLATVVGHQRRKGWILVDAGWMAMSRDRSTARQSVDQGYGLACDLMGQPHQDLIMIEANQEQGILAIRPGSGASLPELALGTRIRILPNHACATSAQHDRYNVIVRDSDQIHAVWQRFGGW